MFRLWISVNEIGCSVLKTSNLFENIYSFIGGEQFDMFDDGEPQMMNGAPDFMGENQFEESQVQNNHLSDPWYILFAVSVNGTLKLLNNTFNKMSTKLILFAVHFNDNNNVLGFMYRNNDHDWNYTIELI